MKVKEGYTMTVLMIGADWEYEVKDLGHRVAKGSEETLPGAVKMCIDQIRAWSEAPGKVN